MSFEHLRVYQAAELLDREVTRLLCLIPPGNSRIIDQLRRAVASILLNIAEAYGSLENGTKLTHLGVARGSTDETRAILRKCVRDGLLKASEVVRSENLCRTVAKMLTGMIEHLQ